MIPSRKYIKPLKKKKKGKIRESQLLTGSVDHVNKRFCFVIVNELNEDIVTALYASPPMSAKAAMKQKCPLLVQAALAAIEKEKKNLIDNKVMKFLPYKDIPEEYRNKIISTFVFIVNKMKTDGSFNEAKCRVVCNGSQEKDNMYTRTASPVVNKCLLYLMFQLILYHPFFL